MLSMIAEREVQMSAMVSKSRQRVSYLSHSSEQRSSTWHIHACIHSIKSQTVSFNHYTHTHGSAPRNNSLQLHSILNAGLCSLKTTAHALNLHIDRHTKQLTLN